MVDQVATLLIGRGHPVRRLREVGLANEEDLIVAEYAIETDLVIVTFDPDFRSSAVRKGARCLHIRTPERRRGSGSPASTGPYSISSRTGPNS
jgi:predicted nuclease of predicted toxin-antitoxin system